MDLESNHPVWRDLENSVMAVTLSDSPLFDDDVMWIVKLNTLKAHVHRTLQKVFIGTAKDQLTPWNNFV